MKGLKLVSESTYIQNNNQILILVTRGRLSQKKYTSFSVDYFLHCLISAAGILPIVIADFRWNGCMCNEIFLLLSLICYIMSDDDFEMICAIKKWLFGCTDSVRHPHFA
jgi:hypothetical protein